MAVGLLSPAFSADPAAPLPLPGPGTEAAADAQHLLIALAEGARDPQWPERPAALPDAGDDGLARRWQWELPLLLARLDGHREAALAALDQHCVAALGATRDANLRLGIALDHLPAPSARAEVAAAIGRAWDRGRLRAVVALAAAEARADADADATAASVRDPRAALAQDLLAGGAADPLPLPGLPEAVPAAAAAVSAGGEGGLTITWAARPGWVFGLDAAGRVAWQRAVPLAAQESWGDGGAVLRSAEGLIAVDETGAARALGPMPARARLSVVAGAAAWFVLDAHAWRVALTGTAAGTAQAGDLGEEPVAPPLALADASARPWRSLWLTGHAVVWWPAEGPPQALRHGLPVGPGWRLAWDAGHAAPLIVAPDGRRWRLPARGAGGAGDLLQQARLAIATGAAQHALDLLAGDAAVGATLAGRRAALAAHIALGPGHLRSVETEVVALANACERDDPVLAARVWYALVAAAMADPHPVVGTPPPRAEAFMQDLAAAKQAAPDALYSRNPDEVLDDPAQWRHALSADALALTLGDAHPGADWTWAISHPSGWTEVTCHDASGALMWRHRWPTDDGQPSRSLARKGDWLLVAEGQDRLLLLTAATGDIVLAAPLDGMTAPPESVCVLSPRRLAVLEPPGLDDRVVIFDAGGPPVDIDGPVPWALPSTHPLPAPALSMVSDAGLAVVALADGRSVRF